MAETPKPKPPVNDSKLTVIQPAARTYVRQDHLQTKPFRDSEGLRQLQSELHHKNRR